MTAPTPEPRLVYDDLATPEQMRIDGRATGDHLEVQTRLARAVRAAVCPAPSLHFDEQPREQPKGGIEIDEATARLAGALHFHLG